MRLGLRLRLTIGYTVLSAAVASALVAFVVLRLEAYLQAGLDRELARSSAYIARSAGESRARFREASRTVLPPRGAAAQVVSPRGRVLRAYGDGAGARPLAPADARRAALAGDRRLLTVVLGDERRRFRAIVSPVEHLGRRHVLIVAESLRGVEDAVGRVLWPLLLAAPVALAATALGGSWLAVGRCCPSSG